MWTVVCFVRMDLGWTADLTRLHSASRPATARTGTSSPREPESDEAGTENERTNALNYTAASSKDNKVSKTCNSLSTLHSFSTGSRG